VPLVTPSEVVATIAGLSFRWKVLLFASVVVLVEIAFRRLAPKSRAYARWTSFFQGIGQVWTAVLLSLIYLLSVGPVSVFMKLFGRDLLDRTLHKEPTFWRPHDPNPLGPLAAVRHQF
jgi:hypothetical protein